VDAVSVECLSEMIYEIDRMCVRRIRPATVNRLVEKYRKREAELTQDQRSVAAVTPYLVESLFRNRAERPFWRGERSPKDNAVAHPAKGPKKI